jgi:hypothetical protein
MLGGEGLTMVAAARLIGPAFGILLSAALIGAPAATGATSGRVADLRGEVVDETPGSDGQGIAVTVLQTDLTAEADASGRFELRNVPCGEQTLRFVKEGYLDHFEVVDVRAGAEPMRQSFRISFEKGFEGTLTLPPDSEGSIVTSLKGQPVAGASIVVKENASGAVRATATSAADGRFALTRLTPLENVAIAVTHPDHEPETMTFYVVPRGENTPTIYLRALRWGTIAGHVTDARTGEPLAARVEARGSELETYTDSSGRFELYAPEGTYELEIGASSDYERKHMTGVVVRENQKTDTPVKMEHAAPGNVPASQ